VEWPAKRCYVGLGAVGVQEQAEDILVPSLLRNCLTLMTLPFLPSRTVVFAIALKLLLFTPLEKMSMMMMMMLICDIDMTKSQAAVSTAALSAETQKWR